jgi:hypothetical protein
MYGENSTEWTLSLAWFSVQWKGPKIQDDNGGAVQH